MHLSRTGRELRANRPSCSLSLADNSDKASLCSVKSRKVGKFRGRMAKTDTWELASVALYYK